jgi:hypothetical protein
MLLAEDNDMIQAISPCEGGSLLLAMYFATASGRHQSRA